LRGALSYRPDVDGLRAVAVGLVILYHYHLGPLSGGFIGVDVFFVISGYLITSILWDEISNDRFSIVRFYQRRARRILPPLIIVIATTLILGWFVLLPEDYAALGRQALSAMVGVSNVLFWLTTDYFARDASLNPLLHTWSLAVEEQFYLAWPIALALAWRVPWVRTVSGSVRIAVAGVILASVAWSILELRIAPEAAFYLPASRAWELALGGLLVFLPPIRSPFFGQAATLFGAFLIVGGAIFITSDDPFPGLYALFPCVGASLIIWPRSSSAFVTRFLSSPPMVWVGKLSYSLYLWHWPVLVLYRHENYGEYPGKSTALFLILICVLLAFLTWHFVERTTRNSSLVPWNTFVGVGMPILIAVAVAAVAVLFSQGFPERLPQNVVMDVGRLQSPVREQCHMRRLTELPRSKRCVLGQPDVDPDTVVWGDSHGVELSDALARLLEEQGRSLITFTLSACPPSLGYSTGARLHCAEDIERILDHIVTDLPSVHTVVLASYHHLHYRVAKEQYAAGLIKVVDRLVSAGKRVFVVGPTPEFSESVPLVSARMMWRGFATGPTLPIEQWEDQYFPLRPMLKSI
jgi:peptidoglycan/LPS O-acetylase OafA/YrhL